MKKTVKLFSTRIPPMRYFEIISLYIVPYFTPYTPYKGKIQFLSLCGHLFCPLNVIQQECKKCFLVSASAGLCPIHNIECVKTC